jgi:hypothetical protein
MKVQSAGKTVEQTVAAIQALDLDPIKFKLMDPEEGQGWSREFVDRMAIEYKRLLTLSVKYPEETIAPSKDVDKFWHGHILDTMKYAEDCQNVFGYFLHHFPYFGMRGEEDAANLTEAGETTNRLYKKEFGEAAQTRVAYCAVSSQPNDAAYCAVAKEAAYCAVSKSAAYCAVANKAADCAVAKPAVSDAAYCAVAKPAASDAAYCAVAKKAAYCAVSASAAYCAVAKKAAYCAVAKQANDATYCAVTNRPASQDRVNASIRPTLALAA